MRDDGVMASHSAEPARNAVLVHGAYADGSSWSDVISILQQSGLNTTAVQNPLTSLADDVAATRRALAQQEGRTVLAGHSWAGTVISEAGDDPKVSALVYVAARAPDAGEDYAALAAKFPAPPANVGLIHEDGFARLDEEAFLEDFAGGVGEERARALFAVQAPVADTLFDSRTTVAAWHDKPCYYSVSKEDRTTSPDLERFLAQRMDATTIELDSSHLAMVTHPQEIADLILTAAGLRHA
jgi:pimeloyl-ACP methyl ester carboxylesterase